MGSSLAIKEAGLFLSPSFLWSSLFAQQSLLQSPLYASTAGPCAQRSREAAGPPGGSGSPQGLEFSWVGGWVAALHKGLCQNSRILHPPAQREPSLRTRCTGPVPSARRRGHGATRLGDPVTFRAPRARGRPMPHRASQPRTQGSVLEDGGSPLCDAGGARCVPRAPRGSSPARQVRPAHAGCGMGASMQQSLQEQRGIFLCVYISRLLNPDPCLGSSVRGAPCLSPVRGQILRCKAAP